MLDYRLAPENPFPAAIDDARSAYAWLLQSGMNPRQIAIAGDSAGGNLVFTSLLSIRQHGLPMPACAVPLSPWTDMECSGETFTTKADVDPMVHKEFTSQLSGLYAPGVTNLRDPLLSPLYGDLNGFPPLLIQVGERETLLDDSRRIAERAKKAAVDVTLEIEPGQVHVYQIFAARLDEGRAAIARIGKFIRRHTSD
jgi:acetyl esterase/lipase